MTVPVAVVIPAFAAGGELAETLESVLTQTTPAAEVCVTVDAASEDHTLAVARRYEPDVTVRSIAPTTAMHARQLTTSATTAPLVAPCDADDLWLPTKLERQVTSLEAGSDLDAVFCEVTEFTSSEHRVDGYPLRRAHPRINGRVASALLIRRSALDEIGGFVADDHLAQWIAWLSGALGAGLRFGMVDEVLVRRRLRSAGYTSRHRDQTAELLDTMRQHLHHTRPLAGDPARRPS